jgi:hypothetical protein
VRETLRRDYGKQVSRKKAARLMRENGLNARRRRKFIPATTSNHGLEACENILFREFQADRGGEKRASSYQRYAITYLRTLGGWVYLTVVLDLFDRKVIGWAFSSDMETIHTTIPDDHSRLGDGRCQPEGPAVPFRPGGAVLCENLSGSSRGTTSLGSPEHEGEGELPGQRLRRIVFQDPEAGVGNLGRQTCCGGGKTIGVHVCGGLL